MKQAFDDEELRQAVGLNSANSINISRLLAQVCYYFEALAQLPKEIRQDIVISVPSGNFGNLTAGLIAKTLGLPIKRFIAATNANDTVPRYLNSGKWQPHTTVATLSNAMDVGKITGPRVEELFKCNGWSLSELSSGALSDKETEKPCGHNMPKVIYATIRAIAYRLLRSLQVNETGIFLVQRRQNSRKTLSVFKSRAYASGNIGYRYNKLPLLSDEMENDFALTCLFIKK